MASTKKNKTACGKFRGAENGRPQGRAGSGWTWDPSHNDPSSRRHPFPIEPRLPHLAPLPLVESARVHYKTGM
jgi:hypothetical protein